MDLLAHRLHHFVQAVGDAAGAVAVAAGHADHAAGATHGRSEEAAGVERVAHGEFDVVLAAAVAHGGDAAFQRVAHQLHAAHGELGGAHRAAELAIPPRAAGDESQPGAAGEVELADGDLGGDELAEMGGDRPVAVFWSSKMAIDTDGPAAGPGRPNGKALDPASGQNDTSLHFANGGGLPAEIVPYIVLPQLKPGSNQTFNPEVAIGDIAIVIFKDKTAAAVCGDLGPFNKIGEASIRVHEGLQQQGCPDPCSRRDANGFCQRALNASVEQDVLYFVFPNSAFAKADLNLETINTKIKERAFGLYNKLRGAS